MIGHIAYAEGSPCPTLVLDGRMMPLADAVLLPDLTQARVELAAAGFGHVLKTALIQPSAHPLFDLDYRFVQSLPGGPDLFELGGSCGHSILSAVLVAARTGMIAPLSIGGRVRVNVTNNGDHVVCDIDKVRADSAMFTAYFVRSPTSPVRELLMTGESLTSLATAGKDLEVSLISMGNPYIFVAADSLGVHSKDALFADDADWFATLSGVREAVCALLGRDPAGVFPKIAALLSDGEGAVAARAISVPSWHPTLALTGAICLGAAIRIEGTVPWSLAGGRDIWAKPVRIVTPGSALLVTAHTKVVGAGRHVVWVSVGGKQATFLATVSLSTPSISNSMKERTWLPLSA